MPDLLPAIEIETSPNPNASVIWLHGLGDDGHGWSAVVPGLKLPPTMAVRFLFPHAPTMPVTINNGYVMRAWYDILSFEGINLLGEDLRTYGRSTRQMFFAQEGHPRFYLGARYRFGGEKAVAPPPPPPPPPPPAPPPPATQTCSDGSVILASDTCPAPPPPPPPPPPAPERG